MCALSRFVLVAIVAFAATSASRAEDFRLVRSVSGPSGRVEGSRFVFDENRTRFIHPRDKSFIVYFEWEAPPGTYTLSGLWKEPDGRTGSISPDVRIVTNSKELNSYWTYTVD